MNRIFFGESLAQGKRLLKDIDLFRVEGTKPLGEVSDEFRTASIRGKYLEAYEVAKRNLDFDILLKDESFFQFSFENGNKDSLPKLRYAFFQNPQEYVSYTEFLSNYLSSTYEEVGDSFIEEHSQYLSELEINTSSAMIRYDLDCSTHKPLLHAVSHIHIGNSEHIRIPINRVMTPCSFVVFIIKNIYYGFWKYLIEENAQFDADYYSTMKSQCPSLEKKYWDVNLETKDFFLG